MLTPDRLREIQETLGKLELDGWLLFDFHGVNPIPGGMLGVHGMVTRRYFVLIPREGEPVALTHRIEAGPWRDWKWPMRSYSSWRELEAALSELLRGRKVAMEYSPGDAVPYLDRVPAGVLEMVRAAGATVVPSGELVTRFYAALSEEQLASHRRAAEVIARVARQAFTFAGERAGSDDPIAEHELRDWIRRRFIEENLETEDDPIVAAGANAADPHYAPAATRERPIRAGDILLIDLWAREAGGVYADQTWMASFGTPSPKAREVWRAVRDARDAAIELIRTRAARGQAVRGADADDAARNVIKERGFGEYFTHRTGHSIDPRDLHGSGPHIDNLETREERVLTPGSAFSIEPGVYIPGEMGMRSEVNAYIAEKGAVITPGEYQRDLIVL